MRHSSILAIFVWMSLSVFAAVPKTLYKGGEAVYESADLNSIADYFRNTEKVNVLFKDPDSGKRTVTMFVKKVPKYVILQYAARCAGMQCTFKGYGAVIEKKSKPYPSRKPVSSFVAILNKKISFDMEEPSLEEVVQMLAQIHGVNIVFVDPDKWGSKKIGTLKLKKVTVLQLLNYMTELFGVPVTLDKYAIFVGEKKPVPAKKAPIQKNNAAVRKR